MKLIIEMTSKSYTFTLAPATTGENGILGF